MIILILENKFYLQCVIFPIDFDIFVQKLNANRMKTIFVELIWDKPIHKTTFANSTVTWNY